MRKMAPWIYATVILLTGASSVIDNNTLEQTNANGSAVVLQTIASLQQSGVLGNDNELLRRIAYVETWDGKLTNASSDGGIWAVRENKFLQTQNLEINVQLSEKFDQIYNTFGINWTSVQWRDLQQPLHSMIATRLVLFLIPHEIPPAYDIDAQARFWLQYYNPDGDENDIIGVSIALQGIIITLVLDDVICTAAINLVGSYPHYTLSFCRRYIR